MNCAQCGAYYGPAQRFCTGCGRDLSAQPGQHEVRAEQYSETDAYAAWAGSGGNATTMQDYVNQNGSSYPNNAAAGRKRSSLGTAGAGAVGLLALLSKAKGLLVLLKFGKFGGTFITMLISVAAYAAFFGLPFAIGIILLIFIHEMGHWVVMRVKGVAAGAPIFIPFFGAAIAMRSLPRNVKDEAEIGIAGPIAGAAAAGITGISAALMPVGNTQLLLYALAYTGMLLNLFNLVPVSPLDGGRVTAAISRWAWPAGLCILVLFFITHPSGILALILVFGGFETASRFLRRDRAAATPGYYAIALQERVSMAVLYFGLLGITFFGMEMFHTQLLAISSGSV